MLTQSYVPIAQSIEKSCLIDLLTADNAIYRDSLILFEFSVVAVLVVSVIMVVKLILLVALPFSFL